MVDSLHLGRPTCGTPFSLKMFREANFVTLSYALSGT